MSQRTRRQLLTAVGTGSGIALAGCVGGGNGDGNGGNGGNGDNGNGGNGGGGGTLTFVDVEDPENLDPHVVDTTSDVSFLAFPGNAYETLLGFPGEGGELEPWLATEVPSDDNGLVSDDGLTYEFPLREGVEFHTGGEMTADDVVFSIERAQTIGLSPDVGQLDRIESVEADGDYTVVLTLSEQFAPFLTNVVTRPAMAVVSQEAVEENGGVQEGQRNDWMVQNTAGTGPYEAGEWNQGERIEWIAFDNYWDDQYPNIDRIVQQAVPEIGTRASMIERGDALVAEAPAAELSNVEGTPNAEFFFSPLFDPAHITFNFDIPYDLDNMPDEDTVDSDFFQDPNVRRAFGFAFDYDTYIEQIWNGHATRMKQYHFEGMLGYDENAPNFEYDPEQAEELLREAGYWDGGFTITCFDEGIPEFSEGNLLLKDNLEALNDNITIRVESITESQMTERHTAEQFQFPMEFHGFLPQGPDPDPYYRAIHMENGSVGSRSRAYEHVDSSILDKIEAAANEPDQEDRAEIYTELQQQCFEDPAVLALTQEEGMVMHNGCVEPVWNPAWLRWHMKHWTADGC
ncbi:ABC transporter substrate-binding protein [Natronosalvus caseinilyticus]|uniref:ABC transporter substrate-binding protein n=1 Tax=Natronosalvus caseinilyticus TaxID=2953747 RepID=UPI0028ABCEDE|nr:ABC transporter substrate-binding protein [Natronosalvus caseinilyticus]